MAIQNTFLKTCPLFQQRGIGNNFLTLSFFPFIQNQYFANKSNKLLEQIIQFCNYVCSFIKIAVFETFQCWKVLITCLESFQWNIWTVLCSNVLYEGRLFEINT